MRIKEKLVSMGQQISKYGMGHVTARILILGLDNAGKTSIIQRLKLQDSVPTIPTIGFNVEEMTPIRNVTFTMFDVGGEETLRHLWKYHFQGMQGLIFVVDSADLQRIDDVRKELFNVLNDETVEKGIPTLIIANKQDLPNAIDETELIDILDLQDLRANPWHLQKVSALTGDGLNEGVIKLADMVRLFKKNRRET